MGIFDFLFGKRVQVEFRPSAVNVAKFDHVSFGYDHILSEAWYDAGNEYLLVRLRDRVYHYICIPSYLWEDLVNEEYAIGLYVKLIKGRQEFDARTDESRIP